jgi:hypothetical protein
MNKIILFAAAIFLSLSASAQGDVVQWKFESKKVGDKQYEVRLIATMDSPWHIYSTTTPEGGPVPTSINFNKNPLTEINGKVKEVGKLETHFEKVFDIDTRYYNNKVEFVQVVNVKGKAKTNLTGTVEYMACTDKECLPPRTVPFTIALK